VPVLHGPVVAGAGVGLPAPRAVQPASAEPPEPGTRAGGIHPGLPVGTAPGLGGRARPGGVAQRRPGARRLAGAGAEPGARLAEPLRAPLRAQARWWPEA
jgi:hypothetical protein